MILWCCAVCFNDRGLATEIIPSLSISRGRCSFCETLDVDLVSPQQLRAVFTQLINIYAPDPEGNILADLLREDWKLFDERLDRNAVRVLLAEIFDDGEIVRRTFSASSAYASTELDSWSKLRDELMYRNRYFPEEPLHAERIRQLLDYIQASPDELPNVWFRARIRSGPKDFTIEEMGAPPARLVSHGRANPPGIPYLYLGSKPETAVAEVRPHTGDLACVAEFTFNEPISVVDLRDPRILVSPFLLGDETEIGMLRVDISFLEHLGEELTKPVLPQGAAIDYVPSQFLCEFIKHCGYHGVIYRSSVIDGINLAIFDPARAMGQAVKRYVVSRVSVDIEVR